MRRYGKLFLALSMALNVFGDNATAIRLYETSGYAVTAQQMRREL